jgi:aryl carrier-like protein
VLRSLIADFLKLEASAVAEQDALESLGLDSIAVHELADQAGHAFGVDLPVAAMYRGGCVRGIARWLVEAHGPELSTPGQPLRTLPADA